MFFLDAAFILCSFGQGEGKSERVSPNSVLIRTGEGEIRASESEVGTDSDRRGRNPRWRVRSWHGFGQEEEKSEGKSPKLARIRTGERENRANESEVGADSDRKRRKLRE